MAKVYKKHSNNKKVTLYLIDRNFVEYADQTIDPIEGFVRVDNDLLEADEIPCRLIGEVTGTFRYGREQDEIMGLCFSKVIFHSKQLIQKEAPIRLSKVQEHLSAKLGSDAIPFRFFFASNCPASFTMTNDDDDQGKPLGIEYSMRVFIENGEGIAMSIRKFNCAKPIEPAIGPKIDISKNLFFSRGRFDCHLSIDRSQYYHSDTIHINLTIINRYKKLVRCVKLAVQQRINIKLISGDYAKCIIQRVEPIDTAADRIDRRYQVKLVLDKQLKRGVAVEDRDRMAATCDTPSVAISYCLRVKVMLAGFPSNTAVGDLPFELAYQRCD